MRVGFVGLGIMGRPMAVNLRKAGFEVSGASRSGVPAALVDAGVEAGSSPKVVAERSDVVITMVPDTPDVEAALFGHDGVAAGLSAGKVVVDMSSISPSATKGFAKRIGDLRADYLDAPVSGGEVGAKAASLSIMVGGDPAVFERVLPVFQAMGKNVTRVGAVGDGQTAKIANQIVVALTIGAVAEGLLFAARAGADPAKVREALMGGLATSRILELHGERMIDRRFEPGFRLELHQKDLTNALDDARRLALALPGTALAQQLMSGSIAVAGGGADHSALFRGLAALSGIDMVPQG